MTQKGFFASLFDISFSSLVTTRIIKALYVIVLVLLSLGAVVVVIAGFTKGVGSGIAALVFAAIVYLLYVIFTRVYLEIVIVLFRIMETNVELVELTRAQGGGPASPPPTVSSPPPAV